MLLIWLWSSLGITDHPSSSSELHMADHFRYHYLVTLTISLVFSDNFNEPCRSKAGFGVVLMGRKAFPQSPFNDIRALSRSWAYFL